MQKLLFQIQSWLQYQKKARGKHGIHSPFVYALYEQAIVSATSVQHPIKIEERRKKLLQDTRTLEVEDFGAGLGGKIIPKISRPVRKIAGSSARGPKFGALLYRLHQYLKPEQTLEMGTNLGISTLYLAQSHPQSQIITLEGSPAIAAIARENFQVFQVNPEIRIGEFSESLPKIDWNHFKPSFIFIDGNHRKDPTVAYFKFLLSRAHEQSVFIFDDIHWSPGMQAAWDIIRSDERVQVSIDLFGMGLCFTGRNQAKEHFILKF